MQILFGRLRVSMDLTQIFWLLLVFGKRDLEPYTSTAGIQGLAGQESFRLICATTTETYQRGKRWTSPLLLAMQQGFSRTALISIRARASMLS